MLRRPFHVLSAIFVAGTACGSASAAELGDVRVASHIGQPLVADIELTMVEDAGQAVGVRLADPEVYRGAGLTLPPVLATTHFAVVRRDGRQFVRVTSPGPVNAEHLHLYLELVDRGQRGVRLATLWLTPDPDPAPAPAPTPAPPPVPAPAVAAALAPAVPVAPARAAPAPEAPIAARPAPRPRPRPPAPTVPAPAPLPRHAAEPAACVRQAEAVQACAALGDKNAALHAQLGRLEDRVKGLQATLGAAPAPATQPNPAAPAAATTSATTPTPATPPAAVPVPAEPKPISAIKPLVPRKPAPPPPDDGLPWGWIAGAAGALSAAGAGVVFAVRRRARLAPAQAEQAEQAEQADAAPAGLLARMKAGLAARLRKRPPGEAAAAVEPVLEQDHV